jgi:ATP-dependent helicase/nuclease subunit A
LQFCDFERAALLGPRAELARLIEERYLPPENAELVRFDELERFFESKLYQSLQSASELRRETRFHIFLPAADFTADKAFAAELANERLAVQGVIDLFFTDAEGKLVLCDYKTDRLSPSERKDPALAAAKLTKRHAEQLGYYAKALQEICGRAPDKILIYSLPLGDSIEVTI